MIYFILPLIILFSAILGALAGIGGGVIIRPLIDALNYFDEGSISNLISSFCVLFVALTSVLKRIISKDKINNYKTSIFLGIGASIGGIIGQIIYKTIKDMFNKNIILIIQSSLLIILLILVIIYVEFLKDKGYSLNIKNKILVVIIGLMLGLFSSFLGVGGGPINVAVLILFFSMSMKDASINSLIIIIFSQISKLILCIFDGTFNSAFSSTSSNDSPWWIFLIILIPVAIIGSLIGTFLNKKINEKILKYVYLSSMVIIIGIKIYNIISSSIILTN